MKLQDYISIIRKRWVSIAAVIALAVGAAVALTLVATPTYTARSQVFVSVRGGGTTADLLQGSSFTQNRVASYRELVTSPRVLVPVIEQLNLATTPDRLATTITADAPLNSVLININAQHTEAGTAADIANAVANSLAAEVTSLEQPEDGPSPVQISTVRTANAPEAPSSPRPLTNTALALVLGLAGGFGLAVVRELLDTRVRSEADVRQVSDSSVIATVTFDEDAPKEPLIVQTNPQSLRSEAFRRLRTNLQFLDTADGLRSIVVTSSLPGEGKSTTSINLAMTVADAGSRVILIDADLRRPSVAEYMGLEGRAGLTTVLIGRAELEDVVQPWGNGYLHVLPSGQVPPNPSELLGSQAMAGLLERLTREYDLVIIDTPPLLPVTDAAILARFTNGALVVVGADKLHRAQLAESMGALETVGARVLGVVLNRIARKQGDAYSYYDYSSHEQRTARARAAARRRLTRAGRGPTHAPARRRTDNRRAVPAPAPVPAAESTAGAPEPDRVSALDRMLQGEPSPTTAEHRWPGGPLGDR